MNNVVELTYPEPSIAVIKMEDRDYRNTFSPEIITGLIDSFEEVGRRDTTKVVVIHGYDNYFCCGGTKDELLKIVAGEIKFSDLDFFRLLLDCKLPTVSAMQGHALGGGLVFGCYADLVVMASQFMYSSNFMKYGFTPGMGATYILPKKMGPILGAEMLFSAANYRGAELKERGISASVVDKGDVIGKAMSLARTLAEKPLNSLKLLKWQLSESIRAELPHYIEQELAMHEITFAQEGVKEKIEDLF